jgi:hypothetical protein
MGGCGRRQRVQSPLRHRADVPALVPRPHDSVAALAALAERQVAVATRAQLREVGLTVGQVNAHLEARRWRELGPTVIALHNGPLTLEQQWWAAVLACEAPAALAARTAAQAGGLTGWEVEPVHILVPRGAKVNEVADVSSKVHESRRFTADDIHPTRTPPQVTIERALVDAAVWSPRPRTACGVLAAGVQQRLTTARRLQEVLEGAGRVRHRRLLLSVLADIEGGAQAVSEIDFLRFCRRHGFPKPTLQSRADTKGKRRYLDATFIRSDRRLIGVEIDGAAHLLVTTYWHDMRRLNDLVIDGRRVLRFPSAAIYADDPDAVAQLRAALQHGHVSERRGPLARPRSDRSGEAS